MNERRPPRTIPTTPNAPANRPNTIRPSTLAQNGLAPPPRRAKAAPAQPGYWDSVTGVWKTAAANVRDTARDVLNYGTDLADAFVSGARQTAAGIKGTGNAYLGDMDALAGNIAAYRDATLDHQAHASAEERRLQEAYERTAARVKQAKGFVSTLGAATGYIGDAADHPGAAVMQFTQGLPGAGAAIGATVGGGFVGGAIGGATGSITGPGALATGAAGALAAATTVNTAMETVPALYEGLMQHTQGRLNKMSRQEIAAILKANPQLVADAKKRGLVRGAVNGVIDTASGGVAHFIASTPEREAARAAAKALEEMGYNAAKSEARQAAYRNRVVRAKVEAARDEALKNFTPAGNVARGTGAAVVNGVGAGVGEGTAEIASGQSLDPTAMWQATLAGGALSAGHAAARPVVKDARAKWNAWRKNPQQAAPVQGAPTPSRPMPKGPPLLSPELSAVMRDPRAPGTRRTAPEQKAMREPMPMPESRLPRERMAEPPRRPAAETADRPAPDALIERAVPKEPDQARTRAPAPEDIGVAKTPLIAPELLTAPDPIFFPERGLPGERMDEPPRRPAAETADRPPPDALIERAGPEEAGQARTTAPAPEDIGVAKTPLIAPELLTAPDPIFFPERGLPGERMDEPPRRPAAETADRSPPDALVEDAPIERTGPEEPGQKRTKTPAPEDIGEPDTSPIVSEPKAVPEPMPMPERGRPREWTDDPPLRQAAETTDRPAPDALMEDPLIERAGPEEPGQERTRTPAPEDIPEAPAPGRRPPVEDTPARIPERRTPSLVERLKALAARLGRPWAARLPAEIRARIMGRQEGRPYRVLPHPVVPGEFTIVPKEVADRGPLRDHQEVVGRKSDGGPFASRHAARKALEERGMTGTHVVVPASALWGERIKGFLGIGVGGDEPEPVAGVMTGQFQGMGIEAREGAGVRHLADLIPLEARHATDVLGEIGRLPADETRSVVASGEERDPGLVGLRGPDGELVADGLTSGPDAVVANEVPRQTGGGGTADRADALYDVIRESSSDVEAISANTGVKRVNIQKVKDHVFHNEHLLDKYVDYGIPAIRARFDSDLNQALAWRRLEDGTFTRQDVAWLKHEMAERWYELRHNSGYTKAHNAAERKWTGNPWR